MKVIFSGTRDMGITRSEFATALAASGFDLTEIVCGGSGNIDRAAIEYAKFSGFPLTVFHPGWGKLGNAAGPLRNTSMAKYADALIHFWDGKSRGTASMIREAENFGLKIYGAKAVSTTKKETETDWRSAVNHGD